MFFWGLPALVLRTSRVPLRYGFAVAHTFMRASAHFGTASLRSAALRIASPCAASPRSKRAPLSQIPP
jgi:hypothetical protein